MIYMTLIALFIGQSFWVMCASIIFFHWMYMAKNVRNLVFIYRDREYNLASRCLGRVSAGYLRATFCLISSV